MPTKPRSREQLQRAVNVLHEHAGNATAAARSLGIPRPTFQHQVEAARDQGYTAQIAPEKPRYRVPARSVYAPTPPPSNAAVRVFLWGDAHDSPSIPDKSRFRHAGLLASELKPHYIIDIGDTLDLDSLSSHAFACSVDDRQRPGFLAELDSLDLALSAFHETAPSHLEIPRYHLNGNHCYRANRFERNNPTTEGVYTLPLAQIFARYGFSEKAYKEWLFIEGVGFTHAPIDGRGREYSGLTADQTVARESTYSVVWGHTHRSNRVRRHKLGIGNGVDVFNTGTFLPQGYIKQYAGLSQTGWSYGVHELTLRDGQIESARSWSTLELAERYG